MVLVRSYVIAEITFRRRLTERHGAERPPEGRITVNRFTLNTEELRTATFYFLVDPYNEPQEASAHIKRGIGDEVV